MSWLTDVISGLLAGPGVGVTVTAPTFAAPNPTRPPVIPHPSPNQRRTPGRRPTCVIIHATATPGLQSPLAWLCNPESKVSAHYLIDKNGIIYQLVHEEDVAWHAGVSFWQGKDNVNNFSIGIELVNKNDGLDPYPEAQLSSCGQLTRAICADNNIAPHDVIGHLDIAPGRKDDPRGLDLAAFRLRLA